MTTKPSRPDFRMEDQWGVRQDFLTTQTQLSSGQSSGQHTQPQHRAGTKKIRDEQQEQICLLPPKEKKRIFGRGQTHQFSRSCGNMRETQ